MSPVGHLVFKTSEAPTKRLVGSTPTSSAKQFWNSLGDTILNFGILSDY